MSRGETGTGGHCENTPPATAKSGTGTGDHRLAGGGEPRERRAESAERSGLGAGNTTNEQDDADRRQGLVERREWRDLCCSAPQSCEMSMPKVRRPGTTLPGATELLQAPLFSVAVCTVCVRTRVVGLVAAKSIL